MMKTANDVAAYQWILCPVCGCKTRLKIREDTVLENFPLLAPGGISHSGPGGNRQLWPDKNSQS